MSVRKAVAVTFESAVGWHRLFRRFGGDWRREMRNDRLRMVLKIIIRNGSRRVRAEARELLKQLQA